MAEVQRQSATPKPLPKKVVQRPAPTTTKKTPLFKNVVLYGPPGVGKTSLAAALPNVGFIMDPQETGILDLVEWRQCKEPVFALIAHDYEELFQHLDDTIEGKNGNIDYLVLDSLTGMEKLCFAYHCEKNFDGDWTKQGFYSYQQGPKNAAKTDWPKLFDALDRVAEAGIGVMLLGHSCVRPYSNPEGPDYEKHTCFMDKESWAACHRWAKGLFFYNYHVDLEKKGIKNKISANNQNQRFIYTSHDAAYEAKNRFGLGPLIEGGSSGEEACENLLSALRKVRE